LLTAGSSFLLGAEDVRIIADRLISNLDHERGEAAGEMGGHKVWWVLSLSEPHCALYFYIEDGARILLLEDAEAKAMATVKLSAEQYREWRIQLAALALRQRKS
jgi:hypothetical protein